jgi:beta-galactosidase
MIQPIDLTHVDLTYLSGHLKVGGANPQGVTIAANSRFFTFGEEPWLPVMGEIHYSRLHPQDWRDELLKMKSGGVDIAASYVFWIHHEEIESQLDWNGRCDLRRFVGLCAECGLFAFPRIGPWVHGEARNGGFPDWLLARCGARVRQDDPTYLSLVRSWYGEVARQLQGLLWKDGGPVIGIQLENELLDNPAHLVTLKDLARDCGLEVPLYTMTAWGPAQIPAGDELLPIFGGYADAAWDRQSDDWARSSRKHYFFSPIRDDNAIGADLLKPIAAAPTAQIERYPWGGCEIGAGMQVTYHRRPFITAQDTAVLGLVKVGSGNNLQGYYMFHGGTHPPGRLTSMQESQATGYWNDYPVRSYDFQAPIGEFGQLRGSYHALRPLHLFLNDFGARLAPLPATLPAEAPRDLDDRACLRWSVRSDGLSGFVFINNYQRMEPLPDRPAVQLELQLRGGERLQIPSRPVDIPAGASLMWPFNFDLDGVPLKYATAQPVCRVAMDEESCYVFAAQEGVPAQLAFEASAVQAVEGGDLEVEAEDGLLIVRPNGAGAGAGVIRGGQGAQARLLLLNPRQAQQCWKGALWGRERIFLSPAALLFDGPALRLRARRAEDLWFACYPAAEGLEVEGARLGGRPEGLFTRYDLALPKARIPEVIRRLRRAGPPPAVKIGSQGVATPPDETAFLAAETWQVVLPEAAYPGVRQLFLVVEYAGDLARAHLENGELVADDFYCGRPWEIGLGHIPPQALARGLTVKVLPLHPEAPIYIQPAYRPAAEPGVGEGLVRRIRVEAEYERTVTVAHPAGS